MRSLLNHLYIKYVTPSMIRWGAVGVTTFTIDYLLFLVLFNFNDSVFLSNLISVTIATSFNYYMHHKWTFRSNQHHANSGVKYLLNLTFWWFVSTTIIKALVVLGVDPRFAKLVPLVFIVPVNYFVLNKIVFRRKI
jgi:putative flippase GtrA